MASQHLTLTHDEQKQIDTLHSQLSAPSVADVDVCSIWGMIKPFWGIISKAVALIPEVGIIISGILSTLAMGLDLYCRGSRTSAASTSGGGSQGDENEQIVAAGQSVLSSLSGGSASSASASSSQASAASGGGAAQFCDAWQRLKPYWNTIISIVKRIPLVGSKIADILNRLAAALNTICAG